MTTFPAANEIKQYTSEELGHWRFAAQGLRWSMLGVILNVAAFVILLIMFILLFTVLAPLTPRNYPSPSPVPNLGFSEPMAVICTFLALGCSLLGTMAILIGLTLCSFAPRPNCGRWLAWGALLALIASQASFGRAIFSQFNMRAANISGLDQYMMFSTGIVEFLLSIILGSCYLLAVAQEFQDRELMRRINTYLKMIFAAPGLLLFLGLIFSLVMSNKGNQSSAMILLFGLSAVAIVYSGMSYALIKLLMRMNRTILSVVGSDTLRTPPVAIPQPVIDPLAD